LVKDDDGLRAKRFGEFETDLEIKDGQRPGPTATALQPLWTLLKGFEPLGRPVRFPQMTRYRRNLKCQGRIPRRPPPAIISCERPSELSSHWQGDLNAHSEG
jgi:hypothetical protein